MGRTLKGSRHGVDMRGAVGTEAIHIQQVLVCATEEGWLGMFLYTS